MKNSIKILIGVVVATVAIFLTLKLTGYGVQNENYDDFAKCLTEKGVKMYGAYWCGHCKTQKEMLGDSWQYVNYVECSNPDGTPTAECTAAGIEGYPTWE